MENNLNYIERLLEFGLEISIAQQMINSMNQTMSNMNIPGSAHTIEREKGNQLDLFLRLRL